MRLFGQNFICGKANTAVHRKKKREANIVKQKINNFTKICNTLKEE